MAEVLQNNIDPTTVSTNIKLLTITLYTCGVFIQFPLPCPLYMCCDLSFRGSCYSNKKF